MIRDYGEYKLSKKEKLLFYGVGYLCIFIVVYLFYHSFVLSMASGVLLYKWVPLAERKLAQKRMHALNMQFKDMLYSLSASIAAGRQMEEALVEAEENLSILYGENEPIMQELRYMRIHIVENKESDKLLLLDFALRSRSEDINNFVQVYMTCRTMGGNLEKIIEHTTEILTDKMNIEREIQSITASKKMEGRIISIMPVGMLLMMNLLSASYIAPLYDTIGGRCIMTAALAGMIYGIYLMERLSDIQV